MSAQRFQDFIVLAKAEGWNVCVIATPHATKFIDIPLLERLTGYPVRSEYKRPEEPDVLPRADAIVVYPATVNNLNKWTLCIADILAVSILCEYMGLHMPIVAVPYVRTDSGLDNHPAFAKSLAFVNVPPVRDRRLLRRCRRWPRPDRKLLVSHVQNNLR